MDRDLHVLQSLSLQILNVTDQYQYQCDCDPHIFSKNTEFLNSVCSQLRNIIAIDRQIRLTVGPNPLDEIIFG